MDKMIGEIEENILDINAGVSLAEEVADRVEILVTLAFNHVRNPEFKEEIENARNIFFDIHEGDDIDTPAIKPVDQNNFIIWFICDYILKDIGKTPLRFFLDCEDAEGLSEDLRKTAEALDNSYLSLYDIFAADEEEQAITLRELFTLRSARVTNERLMRLAETLNFFALRLIRLDGNYHMAGDLYFFPEETKEAVILFLKNHLPDPRALVPETLEGSLKKKGYLFNRIQMSMCMGPIAKRHEIKESEDVEEEKRKLAEEANKKETDSGACQSIFSVDDFDKVKGILNSTNLLGIKNEDENTAEYSWFKSPQSKQSLTEDGTIKLTRRKLTASTIGQNNLDAVKSVLMKELKSYASHMYDNIEKRRGFLK